MATEFNYVANIDTTRVMGAVAEIRSQIGMAFSSPTGFASAATALLGSGTDASGGAASAARQMMAGFGRFTPNMFGGTFTNAAMAYTPHYGMIQAQTTLAQELRVHRGGLEEAAKMAPPGVAPAEYFLGSEKNLIGRQVEAAHNARFAATASLTSGVAGLAAWSVGDWLGGAVGAKVGAGLATKYLGSGAASTGGLIGGLYLGYKVGSWASEKVGGAIQEHYANIERIGGITKELGELAGAGRGLGRTSRYKLGVAAREAASDLKMDVQEMGNILAVGRELGMLPSSTKPEKARQQFRDFAKAIDEGAQVLHTSLANAAQVIRTATSHGMTAREGVIQAAAMGGAGAFNRFQAFGAMGGRVAEANLLSRQQGFSLFTGAVGAMSGAGLSHAEMRMLGGKYGAASMMAQTQMAAALSPMGDMQLMASLTGEPLQGPMGIAGQAIAAMGEGGDFIGNMIRFQTHKRELLRGVGAKGIRTMARAQVEGMAEMFMSLSPGVDREDARIFAVMNSMGKNELQAKAYVRGLFHGGGGGGMSARGKARALIAAQGMMIGEIKAPAVHKEGEDISVLNAGITGAIAGGTLTSFFGGSAAGAVVGFGIGAGGALIHNSWDAIKGIFGSGPKFLASAEEKADYYQQQQTAEIDRRMAAQKARIGFLDIDEDIAAATFRADLGGTRLNLDALGSPQASRMVAGRLAAAGVSTVRPGMGTIKINDHYYSTSDVREVFDTLGKKRKMPKGSEVSLVRLAGQIGGKRGLGEAKSGLIFSATELSGKGVMAMSGPPVAKLALKYARTIINMAGDTPEAKAVLADIDKHGIDSTMFRELMSKFGMELPEFNADVAAGIAIAGGAQGMQKVFAERERAFFEDVMGIQTGDVESRIAALQAKRRQKEETIDRQSSTLAGALQLPGVPTRRLLAPIDRKIEAEKKKLELLKGLPSSFVSSDYYAKAKQAVIAGDMNKAQAMLDLARDEAQITAPEGVTLPTHIIDADRRMWRRSTVREDGLLAVVTTRAARAVVGGVVDSILQSAAPGVAQRAGTQAESKVRAVTGSAFVGFALGSADKAVVEGVAEQTLTNEQAVVNAVSKIPIIGEVLSTSWAENVKEEDAALAGPKPSAKKKKRGAGMVSRAIGWGARENALDSINRSLRHTERALSNLSKRVSQLPSADASTPSGKDVTKTVPAGSSNPHEGAN